jgi:pimeloyl-ACP methyl ester carboxylesterase
MKRLFAVLVVSLFLLTAPVHAYYKNSLASNATGVTYSAEARYHSPILFIPGVGGTYLVDGNEDELWPGGVWYHGNRGQLALREDGTAPEGVVVRATTPIRIAEITSFKRFHAAIYDGFYRWMDANTSYTFRGRRGQYGGIDRAYFDHPYDWRLSNKVQVDNVPIGPSLRQDVDDILKRTRSDKIILVAHSMGGVQARLFAEKYPNKVRGIIFFSTPHHGSPRAFYAMTEGYNFGASHIPNATFWGFARNWPAAAELMPDFPFVRNPDGSYWTLEETYKGDWVSKQAFDHYQAERWPEVSDQENLEEFLRNDLPTGPQNRDLVERALLFRKEFNAITLDSKIRVELINGDKQSGTIFEHIAKPVVGTLTSGGLFGLGGTSTQIPYPLVRFDPQREARGDVTVSWKGLQWEKADRTQTVNDEHGNVPNNQTALRMMMEIVEDLNHDRRDDRWLRRIDSAAEGYMTQLRGWEAAKKAAESYAKRIKEMEKRREEGGEIDEDFLARLKGDLEGRAKKFVFGDLVAGKPYYVNIVAPGAGDYDDRNKDFKAWVVINNMQLVDSGIGTVRPANMKVTVRSVDVLEGKISPRDAWEKGLIDIDTGLIQKGLLKAARLVQRLLED